MKGQLNKSHQSDSRRPKSIGPRRTRVTFWKPWLIRCEPGVLVCAWHLRTRLKLLLLRALHHQTRNVETRFRSRSMCLMCIQFLLQDVGVAALAVQDWCSQPWSIAALQALPAHRSQRGRQNRQSPRSPLGRKAASRERERERDPNLVERAPYLFLHLFLPSPVGLGIPQQEQGDHLASEKKVQEDPAQYCAFWSSSKMISFTYLFICWACVSRRLDFRADSWPLEWNSNKEHKSGDGKRRQTRSRRVRSRGFDHTAVSAVILQANISEQCHCRCQVGDDHLPGGFSASTTRERLVGTAVKFRRRRSASRKAQLT